MAWRSHPQVYAGFYWQNEPLDWEEHRAWWMEREHRMDWIIILTEGGSSRAVGSVTAYRLDSELPEVGIYIGEVTLWGKGVAQKALTQAVGWLKKEGHRRSCAIILDTNVASQKAFQKSGFTMVGPTEWEGWSSYEVDLRRQDFN